MGKQNIQTMPYWTPSTMCNLCCRIWQSSIFYPGSLGWWDEQLIDQASDVPSIIFFIISYRLRSTQNSLFYFLQNYKKVRKKIEIIFAKNFARLYEKKKNTWKIRHLVDKSFVPATQRIGVLYCRLSDL